MNEEKYETMGEIPIAKVKEVVLKDLDTAISTMIPDALPGHRFESIILKVTDAICWRNCTTTFGRKT